MSTPPTFGRTSPTSTPTAPEGRIRGRPSDWRDGPLCGWRRAQPGGHCRHRQSGPGRLVARRLLAAGFRWPASSTPIQSWWASASVVGPCAQLRTSPVVAESSCTVDHRHPCVRCQEAADHLVAAGIPSISTSPVGRSGARSGRSSQVDFGPPNSRSLATTSTVGWSVVRQSEPSGDPEWMARWGWKHPHPRECWCPDDVLGRPRYVSNPPNDWHPGFRSCRRTRSSGPCRSSPSA
ncbi:MAG: hypothetical protein CM1200mP26_28570 [Acidimicrobiales bacterium]|nr:MAG: hypothetical protein CM1200mP26_28570 [Acidimicrobiales bacterium]